MDKVTLVSSDAGYGHACGLSLGLEKYCDLTTVYMRTNKHKLDYLTPKAKYGAHEIPIPGISGEALAKRISKEQDNVHFIGEFDDIVKFLKKTAQRHDIVVIQGAGSINQLAKRLVRELS